MYIYLAKNVEKPQVSELIVSYQIDCIALVIACQQLCTL